MQVCVADIDKCSFPSWYDNFCHVTIKSEIIPLNGDYCRFICSDGIKLPNGTFGSREQDYLDTSDEDDFSQDGQEDGNDSDAFQNVEQSVEEAIRKLGSPVFPKLNWSAPKDAKWMGFNNSLACHNYSEVLLLLKSSDFIAADLTNPYFSCKDVQKQNQTINNIKYHLVLRKYVEMNPCREFRCFIFQSKLIAVSQRHIKSYFEEMATSKDDISQSIQTFYSTNIKGEFDLSNYTFDVYLDKSFNVTLVDFNVLGEPTEPLLFTYEELISLKEFTMRIQTDPNSNGEEYGNYRVPIDFMDLHNSDIVEFARKMYLGQRDVDLSDSD